ncbi:Uncharacterized protein YpeB [hydrothermal vent metagenome]|uniref:Uncharacterized protein YpeB n=1 Tax=hydrothermal vent metagenome TaxID=652676 RepID=A0A3B0ZCD9_9ZZZZ
MKTSDNIPSLQPDPIVLKKLLTTRMPFGKYKNSLLIDLPEPYVVWFARQGFPSGELGELLSIVHEVKVNGLEPLFEPLRTRATNGPKKQSE